MDNRENDKLRRKELRKMRAEATQDNPYYIVSLIILLWPAGLYYMWKKSAFSLIARVLVTIGILTLFSIIILGMLNS